MEVRVILVIKALLKYEETEKPVNREGVCTINRDGKGDQEKDECGGLQHTLELM